MVSVSSVHALNKLGGETVVSTRVRTRRLTGCEDVVQELLRETLKEPRGEGDYRSAAVYLLLLKEFKFTRT